MQLITDIKEQPMNKLLIDDTFKTLETHFKKVIDKLENSKGHYVPVDDDD